MIPKELLKEIRRIEIYTRRLVNDVLAGSYHSAFKGLGMEFAEVREYQAGDDIRAIDWNVSARLGHPYVKIFTEERELTLLLVMDISPSMSFGSTKYTKREIAARIAALLAFSAIRNNDRVGLLLFSDGMEKLIPPDKGRSHVLRVILELLNFKPKGKGSNMAGALQHAINTLNRKSTIFLLSDFWTLDFKRELGITARKHDIIGIPILDPLELDFPPVCFLTLEDPESGTILDIDTLDRGLIADYRTLVKERVAARTAMLRSLGVDEIPLLTEDDYTLKLVQFFKMRQRRLKHH